MVGQKLDLLESNLNKKVALIRKMTGVLDKQSHLMTLSENSIDEIDLCIEEQGALTEELAALNAEADELIEYLRTTDVSSNGEYASKIAQMQQLLAELANDFAVLQEKEQAVKKQMDQFLQKERKNFGAGRRTSKAALDYFKSMIGSNVVPPQFMDRKK